MKLLIVTKLEVSDCYTTWALEKVGFWKKIFLEGERVWGLGFVLAEIRFNIYKKPSEDFKTSEG